MRSTKTRRARRSTWTGCWRSASPQPPRAPAVTAVIAAAGSGERLGAGGPKAFVPLAGRPMIEWSLDALRASEPVTAIVVAVPPEYDHGLLDAGAAALGSGRSGAAISAALGGDANVEIGALTVVEGGATRVQSVSNALKRVETDLVAIHDAARPLLTPELVEALVAALAADPDASAVIAAVPVTDTIKRSSATGATFASSGRENVARVVEQTVDRSRLWGAQTPQVFRTEALREALAVDKEMRDAATDEAMLIEAAGGRVLIHLVPEPNFKVTTPLDLRVAELLLDDRSR